MNNKSKTLEEMEKIAEECEIKDKRVSNYFRLQDFSRPQEIPVSPPKLKPIKPMPKKTQPLNSKCNCGSGKKYKKCCFSGKERYNKVNRIKTVAE